MSTGFHVVPSDLLPKYTDKCILPPSLLEKAIAAHDILPHPLVFSLNDEILIGVREFTAPENTIVVPEAIWAKLKAPNVSCILQPSLPKATSLRIRPAQFYPHVTNWKYYLESFLSTQCTTLSENQEFSYRDPVANVDVVLKVDSANAPSVVVVDTDIALDVAPLNDIMAAQQLHQEASVIKFESAQEITSSVVAQLEPFNASTHPSMYKINLLLFSQTVTIEMSCSEDVYNTDLLCSLDKFVTLENFTWSTMAQDATSSNKKTVLIDTTSDLVTNMKLKHANSGEFWLYVVPFTWEHNSTATISVSDGVPVDESSQIEKTDGKIQCGNCHTYVDQAKLPLHEAFCFRNNVRCSCGEVFAKAIPSNHWHCEKCDVHGESALYKFKHDKLYHNSPYICDKCTDSTEYESFLDLVQDHMAACCPSKLHECQFCHLIVPQGEATFEDRFQNLTHHENDCGNKTAECYQCGKAVRNKELASHMKIHNMIKIEKNSEVLLKCANINCVSILQQENNLSLCETCYGPLYLSVLDPTNSKLQQRIERRYVLQLTKGCGNAWCRNAECAYGNTKLDFKSALTHVKSDLFLKIATPRIPANEGKKTSAVNEFSFCVTENMQVKRNLADTLLAESEYSENMILKAIAASGVGGTREWLAQNAI